MSAITTHVLDTAHGRPASGIRVRLEIRDGEAWRQIGQGTTDGDGRQRTLMPDGSALRVGAYRLVFQTAEYFEAMRQPTFYPQVVVEFNVSDTAWHHHVPLLLSPFGYSTYRGT